MKKTYVEKMDKKEWAECLDKSFTKKKKDLKVDGFRKGQVPMDVYVKKFGLESLYMDAVDIALPILYDRLLANKETITPACAPEVNIKSIDANNFEVEFTIVSVPEVKLGKYKDLKVKRDKIEVTKEEIDHEIGHLKEQLSEIKVLDDKAKVKEGNITIIDFEGFKDGVAFEGGKAEGYQLTIGSHQFIPGFEEGIVGMKKGESKDITLKFPDDYAAEDLKGKEVVFKVKLNEIKEKVLPEINEDFFKDLGMEGVNDLKTLETEIMQNIYAGKEHQQDDEYIFKCLDEVVSSAKFEVPEEMINDEVERLLKEFSTQIEMQGVTLDQYLQMTNGSKEDLKGQMKEEAKKRVSYRLVIDQVVKEEKITVTKDEVKAEVEKLANKYQLTKEKFLENVGGDEIVKYDMEVKRGLELITGIKKD